MWLKGLVYQEVELKTIENLVDGKLDLIDKEK